MNLKRVTVEHSCNVIRRQIEEEYPDLRFFFLIHHEGQEQKALQIKNEEILELDHGELIYELLESTVQNNSADGLLGLVECRHSGLLSTFKKPDYVALFKMNTNQYGIMDEAQHHIYHYSYQAIDLYKKYKRKTKGYKHIRDRNKDDTCNFVIPENDKMQQARSNMLSDVFAAISLELTGKEGTIKSIAKRRSLDTLSGLRGVYGEMFPFPMAMEGTQLVYEDLKDNPMFKDKPLRLAVELTEEVGMTYGDDEIKQWWSFCMPAQEMAWMGLEPHDILSAAIYTSEDPYVRSSSYIVSEAMELEPAPNYNFARYNPFTAQEVNERNHKKACEKVLNKILKKAEETQSSDAFYEEAERMNERLAEGYYIGWCAYSTLQAAKTFDNPLSTESRFQETQNAFFEAKATMPWNNLVKISRLEMKAKREGFDLRGDGLLRLLEKQEGFESVCEALRQTRNWKDKRDDNIRLADDESLESSEKIQKIDMEISRILDED